MLNYLLFRWLVQYISKVTEDDLNRVGKKYVEQLFDPAKTKTSIVCHPSKTEEVAAEFKNMSYELSVYSSLEKSFLNESA